ncbi:MAG: hypothetical protein FWG39_03680, partial [Alphaproteobacteria bacterium]|nr:hypothetical protein [Alphaproteobacteria bacterium]
DFLNQMAAINSAAVQPNTQVNVNVASIGVSESQLAPLTNGVAGLNQAVNLAWETIYPTTAGILIRYNENWLLLRNPDLARNSANEAWSVTTQDMPLFQSAGQDAAVELVAETFTFDITDAAHFLNLLNSGAINTAANQQNATVVVNVPSIGIASNQLTPLTTGVAGLNQAVNLAWETIYPTTAGILFSYEGNWVLLRSPNLLANPHQWLVTPEDFARFPAEQRDALEVQTREITIDIPSTAEYISRTQAIVDSTNVPYVSRVIVNGTAPFGISAEQMAALTASMATLRPMQNVTLDLQEFYPTTSGIMLGYDNPYVNPWGGPTLAANPQNSSKWAVAAADLDSFQTAGQGGAVEVPTRVVTFDNISSASELINKFPAIADSSNVPYVSQVIVPIGSIGINAEQLTPITNGVYGLNQNVQLNWAQEGIYPTASGILLSYHGNWVMLGKPTSPNLRANPHPWTVSEQDLSLFQNAGQGAAIEVAIPETDTLRYDIASFQDLSNQLTAINNAANQPYTHVIVEFPQNGIGVATGQLADLVGIINDLHSDVEVLNWKIYPAAARIYIRYGTHYEPMQRQPQLVGTPNKWYTHQDDLQSFETAGQGDALALSKLNYSREQDYGFDGQILLRPAAAAADTIVWNGHLADAGNLGIPAGWGRNVVLEIGYNWDLPGGQPAMGNMTGPLLKALHTPDVPTGGNLRADNGAIVTSFGLRDAFDPNQSIGGHPARPMRIDKLGDEGETNWAFNHLRESWGRVGINTHIPHMQSTGTGAHANRIYFEPGGHFIDQEDPMRSRYKTEFFANRGWVFTFGTQNNITLVIEMSKLTLCNQYVGSSNPESVAYQIMQEIFSENNNVELPTLEDVKADINTQNAR